MDGDTHAIKWVPVPWTEIFGWTAFTHGALSQSGDGRFLFDNPETRDHYDSAGAGWQQFVLVRRAVSPTVTRYLLLVEDMDYAVVYAGLGPSDRDHQDHVLEAFETHAPRCAVDCEPPDQPVPEPASIALMAGAMLASARRIRSWQRKHHR